MKNREDHFMPISLIDSQLQTLEEPHDAVTVDIENTPGKIVSEIIKHLNKS
jgi:gluconokinase